jgi:mannose-6-phosphate isomerase-like protein (cupin superfamily)
MDMKYSKLEDMYRGWFIGNFDPSLFKTDDFEVAVKNYKEGDYENSHMHKVATEYTVIVSGEVEMNNVKYQSGDIIVIEPGEWTDFRCLTDVVTTVVKTPFVKNDKYEK